MIWGWRNRKGSEDESRLSRANGGNERDSGRAFLDGRGINTLTSADSVAPFGGAAFHDTRVWARANRAAAGDGKAAAEATG